MKADEKRARALVRERAGADGPFPPLCETRIPDTCERTATNYQHRKNRSQCSKPELWAPSNGLAVCGSGTTGCHGWIHANPDAAWRKGWMVKSWQNASTTPVALGHYTRPLILLDDGGMRDATDEELIACIALGFGVDLEGRIA